MTEEMKKRSEEAWEKTVEMVRGAPHEDLKAILFLLSYKDAKLGIENIGKLFDGGLEMVARFAYLALSECVLRSGRADDPQA